MKRSLALVAVAPLVLLAACSASEGGSNPLASQLPAIRDGAATQAAPGLTGTWQMVSLQRTGQAQVPAPAGVALSAEFRADGQLLVQADCNVCRASYEAGAEGALKVSPMACTRAYCTSAPVDTDFAALVGSARQAMVGEHALGLTSEAGSVLMRR